MRSLGLRRLWRRELRLRETCSSQSDEELESESRCRDRLVMSSATARKYGEGSGGRECGR